MDVEEKYLIISYTTCVFAACSFAAFALIAYTLQIRKHKQDQSAVNFITARGTASATRICFSFFATAVGAWCLVSPAQFAVYTGILGLAMYAIASGMPVLIVALFGNRIQEMHPDVTSIADFAGKRFGPVFRTMVVLICLFNMSINMLAEYTTIGSLFKDFVGSVDYPIIIVVGVLTMAYTAYGGLLISILTDQLQALLSILFILILTIYVSVTFREPIPDPLPEAIGVNKYGYSAIFSMPCALLAATVFSEAIWQKVWASANRRAVVIGGVSASFLITCAVFIFGFGGWLANAGGLVVWDYDDEGAPIINPNLFLFQVFGTADSNDGTGNQPARVRSWIGVVSLILAVTMNEGAIDSIQSGITGTITSHFFVDQHVIFTRITVWAINIPIILVSLQGYPILSLFLISNMLTTCCFLPVLSGVSSATRKWVTESSAIFGCVTGILTTCAYGAGRWWDADMTFGINAVPITSRGQAISYGIKYAWYDNVNYDWDYFLTAAGSSVVGMALWVGVSYLIRITTGWEGPGVTRVLCKLPGFGFITGEGLGVDLLEKVTCGRRTHTNNVLAPTDSSLVPSHSTTPTKEQMAEILAAEMAAQQGAQEWDAKPAPAKPLVVHCD